MREFVHKYNLGDESKRVLSIANKAKLFSSQGKDLYVALGDSILSGGSRALSRAIFCRKVSGIIVSKDAFEEELFRCYLGPLTEVRKEQKANAYILTKRHAFPRNLIEPLFLLFMIAEGDSYIEKWKHIDVAWQYYESDSWLMAAWKYRIPIYLLEESQFLHKMPGAGLVQIDCQMPPTNHWQFKASIDSDQLGFLPALFFDTI